MAFRDPITITLGRQEYKSTLLFDIDTTIVVLHVLEAYRKKDYNLSMLQAKSVVSHFIRQGEIKDYVFERMKANS